MAEAISKIGIIACSGEEIPEGTISRLATRRVLELLRPQQTVTLCLPLFLAGEERAAFRPASTRRSPWTAATSSAPSGAPSSTAAR